MADVREGGRESEVIHDSVKDYYGKRVKSSDDLMTKCCTVDRNAFSSEVKEALKQIHPEVLAKYVSHFLFYSLQTHTLTTHAHTPMQANST